MKKQVMSLYSQTIANLTKLHDAAKHAESKQVLTAAKAAVECAAHKEMPVAQKQHHLNGD